MKRLALVLIVCGVAGAAPAFSHRAHLEMGLACGECHTAAAASTRAQDNLLPAKRVCLQCHKESELPTIPPHTPTVVNSFSHALHLRMGNIAPILAKAIDRHVYLQSADGIRSRLNTRNPCEACHRGLEADEAPQAAMPKMADCLVCHSQIDNPFSCEQCHTKNASFLKPASHIEHFLDLHSTGKLHLDKATCALCHGTEFHCMGCH